MSKEAASERAVGRVTREPPRASAERARCFQATTHPGKGCLWLSWSICFSPPKAPRQEFAVNTVFHRGVLLTLNRVSHWQISLLADL